LKHNLSRYGFAVVWLASHESKISIAQIMKHRTATTLATSKVNLVLLHPVDITFFPRVLRATNHYRIGITPQKQHPLIRRHSAENTIFHSKIKVRIIGMGK